MPSIACTPELGLAGEVDRVVPQHRVAVGRHLATEWVTCARTRWRTRTTGQVAYAPASGQGRAAYEVARRVTSSAGPKSISRITFAGAPAAITPGGRSRVTTEFAPTTQRSPIVTPLVITQPTPNQQFDPMCVGPFEVKPCQVTGIVRSS